MSKTYLLLWSGHCRWGNDCLTTSRHASSSPSVSSANLRFMIGATIRAIGLSLVAPFSQKGNTSVPVRIESLTAPLIDLLLRR